MPVRFARVHTPKLHLRGGGRGQVGGGREVGGRGGGRRGQGMGEGRGGGGES